MGFYQDFKGIVFSDSVLRLLSTSKSMFIRAQLGPQAWVMGTRTGPVPAHCKLSKGPCSYIVYIKGPKEVRIYLL